MSDTTYSFSKIKLAKFCPYKYKLIYVDKIKEEANLPVIFGSAIHELFKDIIVNNLDRKKALGLWKRYFKDKAVEFESGEDLTIRANEKDDFWIGKGFPAIQLFYKNKDNLNIKEVKYAEKLMESEYDGKKFRFIVDLIYEDNSKRIVLLDYKTGKNKKEDYLQTQFYSELIDLNVDSIYLYYIFSGIEIFSPGKYREEVKKYINEGIDLIESKNYHKNVSDNCKKCFFYQKECNIKN